MGGIVAKRDVIGQNVFSRPSMHSSTPFEGKNSKHENPYSVSELAGNARIERSPALKNWTSIALLTLIVVCVVALLLGFGEQSVYDGSFDLTLKLLADPTIDENSVYFADCWRPSDAAYAMRFGPRSEQPRFEPGESVGDHARSIRVPFSGRTSFMGFGGSYVEPKFLVVEYATSSSGERVIRRKQFAIPKGRGARSMTIVIP